MDWKSEKTSLLTFLAIFLIVTILPRSEQSAALALAQYYAHNQVFLCLVPAFFIAGAVALIGKTLPPMTYLGAKTDKPLAYAIAALSGLSLAVGSYGVLPIFAGVYQMGAGIGPATTLLYAGAAINIVTIVLTIGVFGLALGTARTVGAILLSLAIGLCMQLLFKKHEQTLPNMELPKEKQTRSLCQNSLYLASMLGILLSANGPQSALTKTLTIGFALLLAVILVRWLHVSKKKLLLTALAISVTTLLFPPPAAFTVGIIGLIASLATTSGEASLWLYSSWNLAKQTLPLFFVGILFSGALFGHAGHEGLIPGTWIATCLGDNSLLSNFLAALVGGAIYLPTLSEVPVCQGLMNSSMAPGPALALLLTGPTLSLPSILAVYSIMGAQKTITFTGLVIISATFAGVLFGM